MTVLKTVGGLLLQNMSDPASGCTHPHYGPRGTHERIGTPRQHAPAHEAEEPAAAMRGVKRHGADDAMRRPPHTLPIYSAVAVCCAGIASGVLPEPTEIFRGFAVSLTGIVIVSTPLS